MRTYDRLRLREFHPNDHIRVILTDEPVVVIADEVASQALADIKSITFPNIAPPWDNFVIDMEPCPWRFLIQDRQHGPVVDSHATGAMASFHVVDSEDEVRTAAILRQKFGDEDAKGALKAAREVRGLGGWIVGVEVYINMPAGIYSLGYSNYAVKPNGALIAQEDYPDRVMRTFVSHMTGRQVSNPGSDDPEVVAFDAVWQTALMAVSLINCSNIKTEDEVPHYPRQMRRRLERAGKPMLTYKRLRVHPHSSARRESSGAVGEGGVAIHLVRGHFKHYTPDKPLFGKYTGTYWWQPMVRGTEQRIVVKDYEVESE